MTTKEATRQPIDEKRQSQILEGEQIIREAKEALDLELERSKRVGFFGAISMSVQLRNGIIQGSKIAHEQTFVPKTTTSNP